MTRTGRIVTMRGMPPKPKKPRSSELFAYRSAKKWTQPEMADEMGVSRATYQRLEKLPRLPKRYQIVLDSIRQRKPAE